MGRVSCVPNYMRATSCSDARAGRAAGREGAAPAPPPLKRDPAVFAGAPRAGRPTCSSSLKGPAVAGAGRTASSDVACSDLSTEKAEMDAMVRRMEYITFDHLSRGDDDAADKSKDSGAASVDGSCGSSDVISDGPVELLVTTSRHRGHKEQEALVVDHDDEDEDFGACKSDISVELDGGHEGSILEDCRRGDAPMESSSRTSTDGISSCALSGMSFEDVNSDCADAASSQRKNFVTVRRRRTSAEGVEQMRPFNPKGPNFLPVETGIEAEKVGLRHQMMSDRRSAEEWMVDYALGKAVKKLARVQKRKVEMLVQAFETVLPTDSSEKSHVEHDDGKKSFTLTRPF